MIAIITLLLVLVISFLITRIASAALTHTGLSREVARFQARSALTGAGFTTNESECLVNHPVRRRILMMLMLVGNAGIITAVSSLILAFVDSDDPSSLWLKVSLLVAGVALLWTVAESELREEGVLLLAIQRKDGQFIGTPTSDVCIEAEDSLVLYGHVDALENLDERRYGLQGNREHEVAKAEKEERAREEIEETDGESGGRD